ncbi:hypothetical protein T08_12142 [Trichinella sp. T8]|nr:hypothetical protein T08_12142 [Trichinella sp. T8]
MMSGHCSERNNTDLVGVTWPGAGGRKSRVGRTIPAHRRPDRYLGIWRPAGVRETPCADVDGWQWLFTPLCRLRVNKKPPDGRARQMAIARSKKVEGVAAY